MSTQKIKVGYIDPITASANQAIVFDGSNVLWANISGGGSSITISNDTTNETRYIAFVSNTSGSITSLNVSNTGLTFNPSTGTVSATIFNSTSDEKYKKDIITITNALEKTSLLRGVNFKWISTNQPSLGLIAQEVEKILPEVVTNEQDKKTLNYDALIGILIESIKELKIRLEKLENEK
jgi:hypothetical protein